LLLLQRKVKVRIKQTPQERELDGVRLDGMVRGTVCNVSAPIGAWLVAQGYAELEMRDTGREEALEFSGVKNRDVAHHRHRRRRSSDR
jgi:hypothetical protein